MHGESHVESKLLANECTCPAGDPASNQGRMSQDEIGSKALWKTDGTPVDGASAGLEKLATLSNQILRSRASSNMVGESDLHLIRLKDEFFFCIPHSRKRRSLWKLLENHLRRPLPLPARRPRSPYQHACKPWMLLERTSKTVVSDLERHYEFRM